MDYFYTALVRDDGAIEFAEHYADKSDRDERAKQLAMETICRAGDGHKYEVFTGDEPYETWTARTTAQAKAIDDGEQDELKIKAVGDVAASKAKSVSVLTAPPEDDASPEAQEASRRAMLTAQLADPTLDDQTKVNATRELHGNEAAAALYNELKEKKNA